MRNTALALLCLSALFALGSCTFTSEDQANEKRINEWVDQIKGLRTNKKTWEEIDKELDIWWPDDEAKNREIDEKNAKGDQGDIDKEIKELYEVLMKRYARDKAALDEIPETKELSADAIKIIKYVAQIE